MKMGSVLKGIVAAAFLAATMSVPAWAQENDQIRIGVIGPMKYVQGRSHWQGALVAADWINAKGGVQVGDKKMKIQLIKADSNEFLNITDAANAMERLIMKDQVDFVVGGFRSEAVLAMQDIAMEHKVIFLGCGASDPKLCSRVAEDYDFYKYWFRATPYSSSYIARVAFIQLDTVAALLQKELNIPKVKVAVVAEKAMWADGMVGYAQAFIKGKGMEVAGVWRPSPVATDVTAELTAIERSGAHIIFTVFSSSVGIPFARQAGELKIPAMQVGINVEAQKDGFWQAAQGMGNYVLTSGTYCRGVEANENTKAFVDEYYKRYGETPTYTSGTFDAIYYNLAPAIEQAGTLDADTIVPVIENRVYKSSISTIKYMKDSQGRPLHDITWGPGYATGLVIQWQDGVQRGIWPNKWKMTPDSPVVTFKGMVPIKIPPWVIAKYKK